MRRVAVEGQGALAEDLRRAFDAPGAAATTLAIDGCLLIATPDVIDICARLRGYDGAAIILILPDSLPALERQLLIGAIEPIAIESAPGKRVAAVAVAAGAAIGDVVETAMFLLEASAVTGQLLTIEPWQAASRA